MGRGDRGALGDTCVVGVVGGSFTSVPHMCVDTAQRLVHFSVLHLSLCLVLRGQISP